jgi:lipopolysaccharide exporter
MSVGFKCRLRAGNCYRYYEMNATSKKMLGEENLTRRTLRGGLWMLLGRSCRWCLGLFRTVVLARLLAPDDFGLFGIAFLALGMLETFSRTGMWEALVRKSGDINPYLDTVWTIGLIRAAGIGTLLFFSAPAIASFFNAPGAEALVQASGLILALQSLSNIGVVFFEKEIEYGRVVTLEVSRTLVELLAAIASYFIFRNAWALMTGRISGELAYCLLSYRIHPYRPKLSLSPGSAKVLFSYGKWILFSSILFYSVTQGGDFLVGKVLGVTVLAFYQMAFRFSSLISTEIMMPVLKVTLPAYSKMLNDPQRLRQAYLKVLRVVSFIVFLVGFLQWTLAESFVGALLGKNWASVAGLLRILIFPACLRALQRTLVQLAKAMGHPDVQTKAGVLQVVILAILIYPAALYGGASGVAFVVLIQGAAGFLWLACMVIPMARLSYREFMSPVSRQLLAAGVAAVVLFSVGQHLPDTLGALCIQGVLGVLFYLCMTRMFCRDVIQTLWSLTSGAGVGSPDYFGAALQERQ